MSGRMPNCPACEGGQPFPAQGLRLGRRCAQWDIKRVSRENSAALDSGRSFRPFFVAPHLGGER